MEQEAELNGLIEDWHRDRIWPKAFYAPTDDGTLRVMTEVNVDYEHGATDAQLLQQINCSIATQLSLYDHIRETLGFLMHEPDCCSFPQIQIFMGRGHIWCRKLK